ncbi:MAG TPA: F0F1 ATP synthase subunit delta [Patescibacteria group bacterium]|nr:F0F1 ATP synthase subunit delta [Patescibacteria group bacterium]
MRITPKHYAIAWYEALKEAEEPARSKISKQFLELIYRSGKLRLLPEIVRLMKKHTYAISGLTPVKVTVAQTLEHEEIMTHLTKVLPNEKLAVSVTVDANTIGGMVVETENRRWNISLENELEQLAHSLNN